MTNQVPGKRLTDKFRKQNYSSGFNYTPGGRLPPRRTSAAPGSTAAASAAPPTPSSPTHPSGSGSPSPPRFGSPPGATPTSPPRKVVSDFKAFGATSSAGDRKPLSVFGAPMLPTGPGGGMFGAMGRTPAINGGMRGSRADDDDDDDDDDGGASFKRDAISLDQVGPVTLSHNQSEFLKAA